MGKAYQNEKKPDEPKSETNALATLKINSINRKQTSPIQSSTQTHMGAMGDSLQFQHQNTPALSI
jgi:hypothetical protein